MNHIGIVVIDSQGRIREKHKPPIIKSSKGRPEYDIPGIRSLLISIKSPRMVIIEKAQAMPAKLGGGVANYARGLCFGIYQGLLVGLGIPYQVVSPRSWQKVMFDGVNSEDTKQASVIVASRLWPDEDWRRSERGKKPDHGLTDAALIARYGYLTLAPAR